MKGTSYVNYMNHIAYCIYALLFFENQVTWFTVNFKTFNKSKVLLNGKNTSLIFYKCTSPK